MNRRSWLGSAAAAAAAALGATGCHKKELVCEGLPGMAPNDVQLRKILQYVDKSPQPERACTSCTLYVAATVEGTCGACKVLHGPINPAGTCKVFQPKPEGGAPT